MVVDSPRISVIIPVYNTEKYLYRCIDSVLAQTFTDFELLLIDDGSTDNSGTICDEYAIKDSRVRVFHKENGGVSIARNFGIMKSRGCLLSFVDSDDWINYNMLNEMYEALKKYDCDIAYCDIKMIYNDRDIICPAINVYDDKIEMLKKYIQYGWNSMCNLLIKRKLITDNECWSYDGISYCEDYSYAVRLFYYAHNYTHISKPLYYYNRINENSTVSRALDGENLERHTKSMVKVNELINLFFKEENMYSKLEEVLSWRMLSAKRGWLLNHRMWKDYLIIAPESNKYIFTNPLGSKKDQLCQFFIIKKHLRPLLFIVQFADNIYKKLRWIKGLLPM